MRRDRERGQTMPFWAIGVLIVLVMFFFLSNYVNAIAWQVRAQNAADSAASSALSVQTNVLNEYSTLLYAAAVDEYRVRVLNQAILNTISQKGSCNQGGGTALCDSDYTQLVAEYNEAVNSYTKMTQLLQQANNITQGGQNTDQAKALSQLGTQCANSATDYACQFTITVVDASNSTTGNSGGNQGYIGPGDNQVDVVACKSIPYFASSFLKLSSGTYPVSARSAAAVLSANSESFNPGTQVNPSTGQVYQPVEHWATTATGIAYDVDFSNLTVNVNWYTAAPIKPYGGTLTSSGYTCS